MKVVHVCKMTGLAGTENHLAALLPALAARGMQVSLVILIEPTRDNTALYAYADRLSAQGVPAALIPIRRDFDPTVIGALIAKWRIQRPDAIHTHLIHADLHGMIAAKLSGVRRIFCSGHNDDPFRRRLPIRWFQRWFWSQAEAGIAISEAVRQFMITVEGAPPAKIHTVHYGYTSTNIGTTPDDHSTLQPALCTLLKLPHDVPLFGSVCRLIPQKGLDAALNAFAAIHHDYPRAHYALIGDGALRATLEAQARKLNIADAVHFLGWRPDARTLFAGMTAFLMPSRWEGFGLVLLEAMAAHVPIIASRISAIPEIVVDGETGILIPAGDVSALITAIRALLVQPDRARAMGEAGFMRLKNEFNTERMVNGTLHVYGERDRPQVYNIAHGSA